jgi:hypothetical protein
LTALAELLNGPRRSLPRVLIPVLVIVAIIGYLVGVHRSAAPSASSAGQAQRVASGASVLLEYPDTWQSGSSPPTLPGLAVTGPLLLAPGGKAAEAGLLSGQLPAGAPGPLPASFLALVHGVPHVEVVSLQHLQAYRFSRLSGYQRTLDVYVIPTVSGTPTALVCYASSGSLSYLNQCEQIVAGVTLVGQTTYSLSPSAGYASHLAALIAALEKERLAIRQQIHTSSALRGVSPLASTLAGRFETAAASLTALEAPQAASASQAALVIALTQARAAYLALARTAKSEEVDRYNTAAADVKAAETRVDGALENYVLLGYNHT